MKNKKTFVPKITSQIKFQFQIFTVRSVKMVEKWLLLSSEFKHLLLRRYILLETSLNQQYTTEAKLHLNPPENRTKQFKAILPEGKLHHLDLKTHFKCAVGGETSICMQSCTLTICCDMYLLYVGWLVPCTLNWFRVCPSWKTDPSSVSIMYWTGEPTMQIRRQAKGSNKV